MEALKRMGGLFAGLDDLWDEGECDLASLEPAWGKAAFFFRTGHRPGHGPDSMRCMSLLEVHRMLDVYRKRFQEGDTLSLLQAISMCAEENLPMPEWLAQSFHRRMTAFGRPGAPPSLDDVFFSKEMPTNSPKKAAQARQDWQLGGLLWRDVWDFVVKDESITSFDSAITRLLKSKKYGVAKTKAKQLVLMVDTSQAQFLGKTDTLPRFLEKRRKLLTRKANPSIV
jgi:hypothetical protein